jgi:hypothetical protein
MALDEMVARVDPDTITSVARQVLGNPAAEVNGWEHRAFGGGVGQVWGTSCTLRVTGTAVDRGSEQTWSAVLKLWRVPATGDGPANDPTHNQYWRREIATYESDLAAHLPEGLAMPRCYGVVEMGDAVQLWIEDVPAVCAWSVERYALAARHLGRFNGRYLAGRPLPAYPWLVRGWLRNRADAQAPFWASLDEHRAHPLFATVLPGDAPERSRALFAGRENLFRALDRLPHCLAHQDAGQRNLLSRADTTGQAETVAIDWAYTGVAPLGTEVSPLGFSDAMWGNGVAVDDLPTLDAAIFEGYLTGLRDTGWCGDARLARLGHALNTAFRFGPALVVPRWAVTAPEEQRRALTDSIGEPYENLVARYGRMQPYVLGLADEARGLIAALGLA